MKLSLFAWSQWTRGPTLRPYEQILCRQLEASASRGGHLTKRACHVLGSENQRQDNSGRSRAGLARGGGTRGPAASRARAAVDLRAPAQGLSFGRAACRAAR